MKKLLVTLTVLMLMFMGAESDAQVLEETNFAYAAYDYSGTHGISYGVGFTFGKVSIVPNTRHSLNEDESTGEINYDGTAGVEIIYWPDMLAFSWGELGLMAAPINVDWLESQDRDLPEYITQAIGVVGVVPIRENLSVVVALKGTDQLFDSDSAFKERLRFGLGLVAIF